MFKLVALWSRPSDTEGFDTDYVGTHVPLVGALPGLKGAIASKAVDGPYYRMAELLFEDADALQSSMGSAEGRNLLADAQRLQDQFGVKLDVLTVQEEHRI